MRGRRGSEEGGIEVGVDMVYADEGFVEGPGERFGGGEAYEEGADEAGAVAYCDCVEFVGCDVCLCECLFEYGEDVDLMEA